MSDIQTPPAAQPNNPLHGIKLADVVTQLVEHYGWEELGRRIDIRCFQLDPSIKSSLKFLRKADWARTKVEELYLKAKLYKNVNSPAKDQPQPAAAPAKADKAPVVETAVKKTAAKLAKKAINKTASPAPEPSPAAADDSAIAVAANTATSTTTSPKTSTKPRRFGGSKDPKRSF